MAIQWGAATHRRAAPRCAYHENRMSNIDNLSIQLYTLRSLGELDYILDVVKEAGYGHVETVSSHLDEAEAVRAKPDARALNVSSTPNRRAHARPGNTLGHPHPPRGARAERRRKREGGQTGQPRRSSCDRACQLRFHQPHGSLTTLWHLS